MTISRCIALRLQPRATSSEASQSSSSGCEGVPPLKPRSLGVSTRPEPKWACQSRLTTTRANSGFAGSVIQAASRLRRSASGASGGEPEVGGGPGDAPRRPPAETTSPGWPGLPRIWTRVGPRLAGRHGVGLAGPARQLGPERLDLAERAGPARSRRSGGRAAAIAAGATKSPDVAAEAATSAGVERPVVEPGPDDRPGEHPVAAGRRVPEAEDDLRLARRGTSTGPVDL